MPKKIEEVIFVKQRRTYTKRLAEKVVKEVLETDIINIGKRNRMTPAEIKTLTCGTPIKYSRIITTKCESSTERFHVMKEVNEELDQKRKSEKRQAEK
ncbi:MAG: hypothetical protein BRC35_08455 [Cyanobacteria bacterium QH_10_48_56]|nr:MAG: hypothetical protein BRC35_08455 [Cyanobacteria bacterium QH_10_48_56]